MYCYTLLLESKKIEAKHKFTVLIRDGAYGQINCMRAVHDKNVRDGRHHLYVKSSGGCSMTESINDLGYGHSNLHRLINSKDFECKEYTDPEGGLYAAAKSHLQKHLAD